MLKMSDLPVVVLDVEVVLLLGLWAVVVVELSAVTGSNKDTR